MGLFKKKTTSSKQSQPQPIECDHKYQDFPWYINITDYGYGMTIDVIEPYVCTKCKKRIDKTLAHYTCNGSREGNKLLESILSQHKDKIRSRIKVEDMIHDFIYVDKDYLKYYHLVNGTKDPTGRKSVKEKPKLKL